MELEDIANQIWNELYWRSFFQEVKNDDFGNVKSFKMHDLVHDLAQSIMEDECHVMEVERPNKKPNKIVRHVTSVYGSKALENVESLKILPESLCNLLNLQTLNLNECVDLERLPNHMGSMINLRHLFMEGCGDLTEIAPKIGQLTNLKSLSIFILDGRREIHLGELHGLNLGGKLYIKHLERVENWVDAREAANLAQKKNLYSLRLGWNIGSESENGERVLDALKPHPNLKELIIQHYPGTSFPRWMSDLVLLQNLVRVSLDGCKNCQSVPPYSQLRWLKHLEISRMLCLERLSREEEKDVFPCLSQLIIYDCPKLTFMPCLPSLKDLQVHGGSDVLLSSISNLSALEISRMPCLERLSREEEKDVLPCLSRLSIYDCPKLTLMSCLPSLKDLVVVRCSDVSLSSISNLSALESLNIWSCDEIESLPEQGFQGLNSLRSLELNYCRKLKSLSEGLQHLKALENLTLHGFRELVSLPEGIKHLHSPLDTLRISSARLTFCPDLHTRMWTLMDDKEDRKIVPL
ncbi:putative disease resistance protein RGA4 [Cornus florida]|uniref:putative disease resistance protein RGA4 n=1 Tax=Cornus florida TaxID=4283 RepID=UPI00289B748D|nr:putative disease resistance protein RGA4 [Cornus florida]